MQENLDTSLPLNTQCITLFNLKSQHSQWLPHLFISVFWTKHSAGSLYYSGAMFNVRANSRLLTCRVAIWCGFRHSISFLSHFNTQACSGSIECSLLGLERIWLKAMLVFFGRIFLEDQQQISRALAWDICQITDSKIRHWVPWFRWSAQYQPS